MTALAAGCAPSTALSVDPDRLQVVTTTGLLADLVDNVAGDRVDVTSLVPDGGDPHTFEPSLRDARDVVYADLAFSNYMLLEAHGIIRALDANLRGDAPNIQVAEEAVKYAADVIPLVENIALDTIWLGLRAHGDGAALGATRSSDVLLSATGVEGPGEVYAYLTGTFGETEVSFDSSDGFDASTGYREDTVRLPADAHTHLSWVFTDPGIYELSLSAALRVDQTSRPIAFEERTFVFAVGVDPRTVAGDRVVLDEGHADLTVDLDTGELYVLHDPDGGGHATQEVHQADEVVIEVPNMALSEVPGDPQFRFLGRPGDQMFQLPQAVLGKHVHGEIDPHLWQNVRNAMAYVELIRDTLTEQDPEGARDYQANAAHYLEELEELDREVRSTIADIPPANRHVVTTHDAYGYLADAYDVEIAGFVTPNPSTEPSLAERRRLTETVRNLALPAVFLEPNLAARSSTLTEVAGEQDVAVCDLYGDSFDDRVTDYVEMMRFNARSLRSCLGDPT